MDDYEELISEGGECYPHKNTVSKLKLCWFFPVGAFRRKFRIICSAGVKLFKRREGGKVFREENISTNTVFKN